jgi:hypothetical protein
MQDLGNAINESLSDSEGISGAICEIRDAGYDVFLVLEATIGFNKRGVAERATVPASGAAEMVGKLTWTPADQQFLKALNIADE